MANKYCFEALDKSLRDILMHSSSHASSRPFGGKVVVLGGDFRQILPIVPRGSREDIVYATINASYLWRHCTLFKLTTNMRLLNAVLSGEEKEALDFSNSVLSIGDGTVEPEDDTDDLITILDEFLLKPTSNHLQCIVDNTYPNLQEHVHDKAYFRERAILTTTLRDVDELNNYILNMLPGEEHTYLSADRVSKQDTSDTSLANIHSVEFLNAISMSSLPNHTINLKVGAPIMLMRNIDKTLGLCNGTRLIVTRLEKHVIAAEQLVEDSTSHSVLIPRITLSPIDTSFPFTLCCRQFPVMLSFAMTINKSQGQTLQQVGLYLPRSVFTHGQLYVVVSHVQNKRGLQILILDEDGAVNNRTNNVVYKEVFCNLSDSM